jgi:alpha-galactosidase
MIDNYSKSVDEFGLDVFRQDGHSIYPSDTDPDRVGMSQIRYTEGFYEFWDGLLKNHPDLIIDNCAGGGRKIDIETMRRSIPLWRSDYQCGPKGIGGFDSMGMQGQTAVLSQWIPLSAGVTETKDAYGFRSGYSPGLVLCWHGFEGIIDSKDYDLDLCRKLLNEYLSLRPFFYGDYYSLTPYGLDPKTWMAWQFNRPDLGAGILQAFRRPECADKSANYKLFDLDPETNYTVTDLGIPGSRIISGHKLMIEGIQVTIPDSPGAAVITYSKVIQD